MAEMEGEQRDAQEVKARDKRALKAEDDHLIDVIYGGEFSAFGDEFEARIRGAERVVQQVKHHKGQYRQAAVHHGARGGLGLHVPVDRITIGAGGAVLADQADGGENVSHKTGDQTDPHDPQGLLVVVQKLGVSVDFARAAEHLEVAGEVTDDKAKEREAGKGHEPFFSDGRVPELEEEIHGHSGLEFKIPAYGAGEPSAWLRGMRFPYTMQT